MALKDRPVDTYRIRAYTGAYMTNFAREVDGTIEEAREKAAEVANNMTKNSMFRYNTILEKWTGSGWERVDRPRRLYGYTY